jgi:single-strand DNA-binding protein
MASFNKVVLMGNLTRDPEIKQIASGAVGSISLAVNRTWFDKASNQRKEEVTFVDVTLWGKDAEVAGQYLAKGRSVLIEGRLTLETWDDKATGQKRSKLKVTGERLVLCGGRGEATGAPQAEAELASASAAFGGTPVVNQGDGSDPEVPF